MTRNRLTTAIKPEERASFYWTKVLVQYLEHYALFERITTLPEHYPPPLRTSTVWSGALMRLAEPQPSRAQELGADTPSKMPLFN